MGALRLSGAADGFQRLGGGGVVWLRLEHLVDPPLGVRPVGVALAGGSGRACAFGEELAHPELEIKAVRGELERTLQREVGGRQVPIQLQDERKPGMVPRRVVLKPTQDLEASARGGRITARQSEISQAQPRVIQEGVPFQGALE